MTAPQYYFPYFFDPELITPLFSEHNLELQVSMDPASHMPNSLVIYRKASSSSISTEPILTLSFGTCLMIHEGILTYWTSVNETLEISQISLRDLSMNEPIRHQTFTMTDFKIGSNDIETSLDLAQVVTFVRKEDLVYAGEFYDQYVVVQFNQNQLIATPFDWFNCSPRDMGYEWPAIAQFDPVNKTLYGSGMHIPDFSVKLENIHR